MTSPFCLEEIFIIMKNYFVKWTICLLEKNWS